MRLAAIAARHVGALLDAASASGRGPVARRRAAAGDRRRRGRWASRSGFIVDKRAWAGLAPAPTRSRRRATGADGDKVAVPAGATEMATAYVPGPTTPGPRTTLALRACAAGPAAPRGPNPWCSTSVARPRVGRMFCSRFGSLIDVPDPSGLARRPPRRRATRTAGSTSRLVNAVRRSARNRSTYHCRMSACGRRRRSRSRRSRSPRRSTRRRRSARAGCSTFRPSTMSTSGCADHDLLRRARCRRSGASTRARATSALPGLDLRDRNRISGAPVVRLREALALHQARAARARRSGRGSRRS